MCKAERAGWKMCYPVAGVLDEQYSQRTPLSGVAVQARQSTEAGRVSILCSLAGRYGYSAEPAYLNKVRLKHLLPVKSEFDNVLPRGAVVDNVLPR